MNRAPVVILVAVVAVVVIDLVIHDKSTGAPPVASHVIVATTVDRSTLESSFLAYKLHNQESAKTDRVTWGQVKQNGPNEPLIAYDSVDHRD